jgi:hypothetical protein
MLPTNIDPVRTGALVGGIAVALGLIIWAINSLRQRRTGVRGRTVEAALTLAAAGIATGVAATGMWRFFSDVLEIRSVWLRGALFAFLEIALFVSALRARRNLLEDLERKADRPSTGIDGKAVWGLAALSGVFAAMDARSLAEAIFRIGAPLVAAWLWERGLAAHRRRARGGRKAIHWTVTKERILVWLRLAEPGDRAVADVDAERRRRRLIRAAYRLQNLRDIGAWKWRIRHAQATLRRANEAAIEHLSLGTDAGLRQQVREELATVFQAEASMTRAAVADLAPWGPLLDVEEFPVAEPEPTPVPYVVEPIFEAEISAPGRSPWRASSTTRSHTRRFATRLAGRRLQVSPRTGSSVPSSTARHAASDAASGDEANGIGAGQRRRVQTIPKRDLPAVAQVLKAKNPAITHVEIAAHLGVTDRTVSTWLKAPTGEQSIVKSTGKSTGPRMGFVADRDAQS